MKEKRYTTVSIPVELAENIERRIEGTGFHSVSSYVTYVLRQVISSIEEDERREVFSKEDEEKIKERLRGLGYLE